MNNTKRIIIYALIIVAIITAVGLSIPTVRESLQWHLNKWRVRVFYILNPPEEAVFVPQDDIDSAVEATFQAYTATSIVNLTPTPTNNNPETEITPTQIPTPLPDLVNIDGVQNTSQHGYWNFCAPANLYMGLSY